MRRIIIRYSFPQHGFDTPTIGHFQMVGRDAKSVLAIMRRWYPQPWVTLTAWPAG